MTHRLSRKSTLTLHLFFLFFSSRTHTDTYIEHTLIKDFIHEAQERLPRSESEELFDSIFLAKTFDFFWLPL
jgi:hypothetical protein